MLRIQNSFVAPRLPVAQPPSTQPSRPSVKDAFQNSVVAVGPKLDAVAPVSTQPAGPGPLELPSPEGQRAIATSLSAVEGKGLAQAGLGFQPEQVYRDELGMTHVRLD